MITTGFVPYSWDPSGARVATGVATLKLKNSTGHSLDMTDLTAPITIKFRNSRDLTNTSRSHYVEPQKTGFHKVNITHSGMALIVRIRPENSKTKFLISVKYGERPTSSSDIKTTVPNFSSCIQTSSSYVDCSRDPYEVFVNNELVNKAGYYFIGIQVKSKSASRKRRCSEQGRSKRACVRYKEAPAADTVNMAQSLHAPQFSKGDENYTLQVLPAACLYWNTATSKWKTDGCKVSEGLVS